MLDKIYMASKSGIVFMSSGNAGNAGNPGNPGNPGNLRKS